MTFSDAVVAIAATLLVLPLADSATSGGLPTLPELINDSGTQILLFLLSFVVICRFWLSHHNIFRELRTFDRPLFWVNTLWMFSIALLPYTTNLNGTAAGNDPVTTGIYIGNMLLTCFAALLMEWHIRSKPLLQEPGAASVRLGPAIATCLTMAAALVIAVFVPVIGAWALLLLMLDRPLSRLLERWISRRPAISSSSSAR